MIRSKYNWSKIQLKLIAVNIVTLLATFLLVSFAKTNPYDVEYIYSRRTYAFLSNCLAFIAKWVNFSIGEMLAFVMSIGVIILFIYSIYNLFIKKVMKSLTLFMTLLTFVTVAIFWFNAMWGLNNYRQDVEKLFKLESKEEITIEVLTDLYIELVTKANERRVNINLDEYHQDFIYKETNQGYIELHKQYSFINVQEVRVKPLLISPLFSSSGYTGIYVFFSGEPCVNDRIPIYEIPFTASHEVAHHKGFASEDEANFIGFLAAMSHEDPLFQYSAYYTGMKYVGNAIKKYDSKRYDELASLINEQVINDIRQESQYWDDVIVERNQKVHNKVNDQFLKVNNQPEGIINYSKVVELLALAYLNDMF